MPEGFIYVEDIIEQELGNLCPTFDVCMGNPQVFTVMRLQGKSELKYDEVYGPVINNVEYVELCEDLLKKAKSEGVDVLLTPEYSFPLQLVLRIVRDTTNAIKPSNGKIWCLCCEGTRFTDFQSFLQECEESGARVINNTLQNTSAKSFVDALIYVFLLNNGQVCLLPQLKTHVMADRELLCEGAGMSVGNVIYKFGKGFSNQLCSIICADALNTRYVHLNNINGINENVILLHPQLNAKPRNSTFANLRYTLYSNTECDNLVYITANWAYETTLVHNANPTPDTTLRILSPWSCTYIKDPSYSWLENQRDLRKDNYLKGLGFGYFNKCKLKVWFSCKSENVQVMTIRKPGRTGASVAQSAIDVKITKLYLRGNDRKWTETHSICCDEDLRSILRNPEQDYLFPIDAEKEQREKYFGLCLGTLEEGQLLIDDNEISCNVSTHIDADCETFRQRMLNNYHRLINCLKFKMLPPYLKDLVNEHTLCLMDTIFNLKSKDLNMGSKATVAYVHDEIEAKRVSKKLKDMTDNYKKSNIDIIKRFISEGRIDELNKFMMQEHVCVFTEKQDTGAPISYPEFQPEITAGDRVSDGISITR